MRNRFENALHIIWVDDLVSCVFFYNVHNLAFARLKARAPVFGPGRQMVYAVLDVLDNPVT